MPAKITGSQVVDVLSVDSDCTSLDEPNSFNATQGCEVPQESHDVNVDNLNNPSNCTSTTSHNCLH